ncbi:MAG: ferredoxin [Lachnospiraceae bacterium]|nr:ferredoxin [Lachnospiraceae bacterium]
MNAQINENCIGCGMCTAICPEVFSMSDDNVAVIDDEKIPGNEESVQEAAESCPVGAIEV